MKDIKLISLELSNFKCFRHLKLDFNGRSAEIAGDNAVGKTTVFDAFMWVLFGKSSTGVGDKNFDVKPLDSDGNVIDHDALTEVEAVFRVDGEELSLRRTYREVWSTKRGSSEATFDGHTSDYFINGVPIKKNGFQDKVNELVDENTFRLLTSTTYFSNDISWQERRAVLFKVAGVMDDAQILATNEQFAPLVESMGKLSLEDYKSKLLAEKRKFVGAKTEIPARISECQKTIEDVESLDFAAAKTEAEKLQAKKEAVEAQILALENDNAAQKKSMEIQQEQLALTALENENKAYRDAQSAGNVDAHSLNIRLTSLQVQLSKKEAMVANEKAYIKEQEQRIAEAKTAWHAVNAEIFSGGTCVACGQDLPADVLQKARDAFETGKKSRLNDIVESADYHKSAKAQAQARLAAGQEEVQQLKAEIAQLQVQIDAAEASKVEPKDMADYIQRKEVVQARVDKLNAELFEIHESTAGLKRKLRQEVSEISGQIAQQMAIISKESLLDYSRQRVEQLRQEAKSAAQCLDAIEMMLYLLHEYSVYKTRFVEDSINGLFRIARFRLFREQANGGVEDRCDVVYDGIAYENLNNGMKINLGIDIINTLSNAYGVRVPLFVDNAESVTNLEKCSSQIIRLVVSEKDKELRVNYEN